MLALLAPSARQRERERPTAEALRRWRRRSANNSRSFLQPTNSYFHYRDIASNSFIDAAKFFLQHIHCPFPSSSRFTANIGCQQRYFEGEKETLTRNVYNIPSDGKLRVSFTGRYLSRSGLTAISIRMDPDSLFS